MNNKFGYSQEILNMIKPRGGKPEPEVIEEVYEPKAPKQESTGVATIGLNGIQVHENGQLSKTKYFDMLKLNEDDYSDVQFTPEEAKKVNMSLRAMSTGLSASIPLTCRGSECSFANTCPYQQVNKAPVGRPCPIEKQLISYWTQQYVDEFNVNFNSPTEIRMVAELAEFDIYEMRVTKYLAENHPTLLQDYVVITPDGQTQINVEISRAFDLKERLKKNRMKVLEALVATRKDKIKIMSDVVKGGSTAEKIDDLKKKLETLQVEVGKMDYIDGEAVTK